LKQPRRRARDERLRSAHAAGSRALEEARAARQGVDGAEADLYELTVGHLFGDIWTRPHLTLRERQIITLAVNIALVRPRGTPPHLRSALHLGFTKAQIAEIIIHAGAYAGWSAMGHAAHEFAEVLEAGGSGHRKPRGRKRPAGKRRSR
jgi:4-carboxymuconolactone decarboxylase